MGWRTGTSRGKDELVLVGEFVSTKLHKLEVSLTGVLLSSAEFC